MLLREEDDKLNNPTEVKVQYRSLEIRADMRKMVSETTVRACGLFPSYVMTWKGFQQHRYSKLEQV